MAGSQTGDPAPSLSATAPSPDQLRRWGLDPCWSRSVSFPSPSGGSLTWHILDTGPAASGTVVCVHGNPTWGYLWRDLLHELPPKWRVIAIDQTGMGYSERPGPRRLADRVAELVAFCEHEVEGPLVLAAHDWGGPVAVGASASLQIEALILANTAVARPADVAVPPLIGAARRVVDLVCRRSPTFVAGTAAMTSKVHRQALRAPYESAERRGAVRDFVADIPVSPRDPSWSALEHSAEALGALRCPVLLIWGGRDPVFHDRFLRDLRVRVPQAQLERFPGAGHLVLLDEPVGELIASWLDRSLGEHQAGSAGAGPGSSKGHQMPASGPERSLLADLDARSSDESFIYQGPDATISWAALDSRSRTAAAGLRSMGLQPGDRVALLLPPSAELLVAVAAIWRAGGTLVAADASAGMPQLRRLIRASAPRFVVGNTLTLAVARLCRFAPGARAAAFASIPRAVDLRRMPPDARGQELAPCSDDLAAIVHTSGATGAAKPVRYSHGALAAQREALAGLFEIDRGDAFTTSFGPFMLLAPSLGMGCVRPDFDVNKPSKLDFEALAAAVARARVTTAWLSPASARTIANTAAGRRVPIRLVMLAGAPIPRRLVEELRAVTGGELRAPYGMTECLPVTDGIDPTLRGPLGGTATGHAVSGCEVIIAPLDDPGADALAEGTWGEILVSAPWMFDGYDGRWTADATSEILRGSRRFHRTGDVGYLSGDVLFQLGRLAHVIRAADGPVPSIILEEPISDATSRPVAAVGVGPSGAAVVAVVVSEEAPLRIAPRELAEVVRAAAGRPIAAVLVGRLPLDRRHQSKVDRAALAASVTQLLSGR